VAATKASKKGGSSAPRKSGLSAVGSAASKAKIPLIAGGAALAGAAGGLLVGTRQARRHQGRRALREVGSFGAQMGRLASELQQAREGSNGETHRSPIEVVLEGLTARRSRA
jgi:hypothetical protein